LKEHFMQANQPLSNPRRATAAGLIAVATALLSAAVLTGMQREANASHALPVMAAAGADLDRQATLSVARPFDPATRVLPDELPPNY
jgi:hypothetical protein